MSVFVRRATAADRAELVRMRQTLWPDSAAREVDDLFEDGAGAYVVFVAECGGPGLCGFAEVAERAWAEGCQAGPVAYLEGIWVDEGHRRSGVGARLVEAAGGWGAARGHAELASDADVDNRESRAFHAAVGFEEVAHIVCFRQPLVGGSAGQAGDP